MIGSTGSLTFHVGDAGPELIKSTDLAVLDDKEQKPISIHQAIGQRPLLAGGEHRWGPADVAGIAANPRRTLQLAVHHTDAEREYAYDTDPVLGSGNANLLKAATDGDWTVIDMTADWATIYSPS